MWEQWSSRPGDLTSRYRKQRGTGLTMKMTTKDVLALRDECLRVTRAKVREAEDALRFDFTYDSPNYEELSMRLWSTVENLSGVPSFEKNELVVREAAACCTEAARVLSGDVRLRVGVAELAMLCSIDVSREVLLG